MRNEIFYFILTLTMTRISSRESTILEINLQKYIFISLNLSLSSIRLHVLVNVVMCIACETYVAYTAAFRQIGRSGHFFKYTLMEFNSLNVLLINTNIDDCNSSQA